METCKELTGDVWSRVRCGKEAFQVLDGVPMCKTHSKRYRIRRGMETGETLETRYYVFDNSIYKVEGVVTKKYFIVRKNKPEIGKAYFYKTNIDIDDKSLFDRFSAAKIELSLRIRDTIIDLRRNIEKAEALLKKVEA